jgi:hypothetical protein
MSENGKGDTRRPAQIPDAEVRSNWDRIFKKEPVSSVTASMDMGVESGDYSALYDVGIPLANAMKLPDLGIPAELLVNSGSKECLTMIKLKDEEIKRQMRAVFRTVFKQS